MDSQTENKVNYKLIEDKEKKEKGIEIGKWRLTSRKDRIFNSAEIDKTLLDVQIPQVPEMFFGYNHITIENTETQAKWSVNAVDALRKVQKQLNEGEHWIQVAVAQEWKASRKNSEAGKVIQRPYDWTFSTDFRGKITNSKAEVTKEKLNMEKLMKKEPILYFDQVILFEDELADNGISNLEAKVRVMPSGIFILLRLFLRIENVLFRVNETRLYCEFEKDYLISEYLSREMPYNNIKMQLPKAKAWENEERQKLIEVKMFSDYNWVSSVLQKKDNTEIRTLSDKILDENIDVTLSNDNNVNTNDERLKLEKSQFGNGFVNYILYEKIVL